MQNENKIIKFFSFTFVISAVWQLWHMWWSVCGEIQVDDSLGDSRRVYSHCLRLLERCLWLVGALVCTSTAAAISTSWAVIRGICATIVECLGPEDKCPNVDAVVGVHNTYLQIIAEWSVDCRMSVAFESCWTSCFPVVLHEWGWTTSETSFVANRLWTECLSQIVCVHWTIAPAKVSCPSHLFPLLTSHSPKSVRDVLWPCTAVCALLQVTLFLANARCQTSRVSCLWLVSGGNTTVPQSAPRHDLTVVDWAAVHRLM